MKNYKKTIVVVVALFITFVSFNVANAESFLKGAKSVDTLNGKGNAKELKYFRSSLRKKKDTYILTKDFVVVPYLLYNKELHLAKVNNSMPLYANFASLSDPTGSIAKNCNYDADCIDSLFLNYEAKKHHVSNKFAGSLVLNQEIFRSMTPLLFGRTSKDYVSKTTSRFFIRDTYFHYVSFYPMILSAVLTSSKYGDNSLDKAVEILYELNYIQTFKDNVRIKGEDNLKIMKIVAKKYVEYLKDNEISFSSLATSTLNVFSDVGKVNSIMEQVRVNNKKDKEYNDVVSKIFVNITK